MAQITNQNDLKAAENHFENLQVKLDTLYVESRKARENGERPRFKHLLQLMSDEETVIKAITKIRQNKGSQTAGIDGETFETWERKNFQVRLEEIREAFLNYEPLPVRRVYIKKPGKREKRPLGIPAIIDRVVQECMRIVLEPIFEAQFYAHSYGFRPDRSAHNAIGRVYNILHHSNCRVAVEGDIKGFFDNINHRRLLNRLWHMGVRDRRVLAIITKMLKAGYIENDIYYDTITGTPQGGVISPLLANVYLDALDEFVYKQWEGKKTRTKFASSNSKASALMSAHKRGTLKLMPMYIVRYADDWIVFTTTVNNAKKIKAIISKFLGERLKLTLSEEKTVITDSTKQKVKFLGYEIGLQKARKAKYGWNVVSYPDRKRLEAKVKVLRQKVKKLRRSKDDDAFLNQFMRVNSTIVGLQNYYQCATRVNLEMERYKWSIQTKVFKIIRKRYGDKRKLTGKQITIKANMCDNNRGIMQGYEWLTPYFTYGVNKIGLVQLNMVSFKAPTWKDQRESRYTEEGRELIISRKIKKPIQKRLEMGLGLADWVLSRGRNATYDLEFILRREEAIIKAKGRCKICNVPLLKGHYDIHHKNPKLPKQRRNDLENLAPLCVKCHNAVHKRGANEHLKKEVQLKRLYKLQLLLEDDNS